MACHAGVDNDVQSPFEHKIPAHIQRSLSSPTDPQLATSRPCTMRGDKAPFGRVISLAALNRANSDMGLPLERARKMSSIPANRFRDVQVDSAHRQAFQMDIGLYQSPLDGRCGAPLTQPVNVTQATCVQVPCRLVPASPCRFHTCGRKPGKGIHFGCDNFLGSTSSGQCLLQVDLMSC